MIGGIGIWEIVTLHARVKELGEHRDVVAYLHGKQRYKVRVPPDQVRNLLQSQRTPKTSCQDRQERT